MSRAFASNYDLIDWSDFKPAMVVKADKSTQSGGPYFMGDIAPFVSPIDGSVISSRSTLRDHERRHGVKQVGTDLKASDYSANKPAQLNERALERAYRTALEKTGRQ